MWIVLTNDDGLETAGITDFREILRAQGHHVTVIAPLTEQSATSHSITILNPIFVKRIPVSGGHGEYIYGIKGTPADCVKLALGQFLKSRPDIIVSGINLGANLGLDVFYSGTVAAALEASFWGVTSFAVSLERPLKLPDKLDFKPFINIAADIIKSIVKSRPQPGSVFNINIPYRPPKQIKGIRFTSQDMRLIRERFIRGVDPRGRTYYWMQAGPELTVFRQKPRTGAACAYTDIESVRHGYISITPLKAQFTDDKILANPPRIV